MQFPKEYNWLGTVGTLPKMVQEALRWYGTIETPGKGNSPVIMNWAAYLGTDVAYTADSVPWCGLFMAYVAKAAGKSRPKNPLWALNWVNFGSKVGQPCLGDVLVFARDGGGHVGLYIGEDKECYHVLAGNQSDAVNIARIYKKRLVQARRPPFSYFMPKSTKPYVLSTNGKPVSVNEA